MGRIGGISRPAAIAMAVACLSASTAAAATGSLVLTLSTVAVSIALIAATILGLSRTSPGRDEAPVVNRLELAHQRISAAVTEDQLGTRAAEELVDMLDTTRVAFIPVEHGRLVIDRGAGGLVIKPSSRSFLAEVSTQRPTTKTTGTGPDGVALVGCPVRIGAKTVAVLVGARDGDHAFTLTEQHVLSRLATMTAKALDELRSSEPEGGSGYEKLPGADELHRDLEALRRERRETTTVLAYVDIDGFLRLAGAEGAETAEWMLESLQRILSMETRDHDRIYRTDMDEFALLLANLRSDQAIRVLDRIRVAVHASGITHPDTESPVTVSIGAAFVYSRDPVHALVAAGNALADAQTRGGDQVAISNDGPFTDTPDEATPRATA